MLVVGNGAEAIHAVVDTSGGADSLADRSRLHRRDGRASRTIYLALVRCRPGRIGRGLRGERGAPALSRTASAALIAEPDGLRLSGSAPFSSGYAAPIRVRFAPAAEPARSPIGCPSGRWPRSSSSACAARSRTARGRRRRARGRAGHERPRHAPSACRIRLGVDLDADVLPLLDGETALAIGGIGADGMPTGQLLLRPSDSDAAAGVLGRIADRIGASGGAARTETLDGIDITTIAIPDTGEVAFGVVDGVVVIGLSTPDVAAVAESRSTGSHLDGTSAMSRRSTSPASARGPRSSSTSGPSAACWACSSSFPTTHAISLSGLGSLRTHHPDRAKPDRIPRRAHGGIAVSRFNVLQITPRYEPLVSCNPADARRGHEAARVSRDRHRQAPLTRRARARDPRLLRPAHRARDRAARDRQINAWIGKGAQPSDAVVRLMRQAEATAKAGADAPAPKRATRAASAKPSKKAAAKAAAPPAEEAPAEAAVEETPAAAEAAVEAAPAEEAPAGPAEAPPTRRRR